MDPEHLDEMERRGDSLLDEEGWRSVHRVAEQVMVTQYGDVSIDFSRSDDGEQGVTVWMDADEAARVANAILSELEIVSRTEAGEFDYPMICSECGTVGNVDDGIEVDGECPWEDCDGTIRRLPDE